MLALWALREQSFGDDEGKVLERSFRDLGGDEAEMNCIMLFGHEQAPAVPKAA